MSDEVKMCRIKSFSAVLHTPVRSSPSYGIFSPRSGEDSYVLVNPVRLHGAVAQAGNRLTASLAWKGTGNRTQMLGKVKRVYILLVIGESNGKSGGIK